MHEEQSSRGLPPRHALRLLHGEWACDAVGGRAAAGRTRRPRDSLPQGGPWPWGSQAWSREVPLTSLLTSVCSAPSGPPGPGSFTLPPFRSAPRLPASFVPMPLVALFLLSDTVSGAAAHPSPRVREGGCSARPSTPGEQQGAWTEAAPAACAE